jgi:hypothetical protein
MGPQPRAESSNGRGSDKHVHADKTGLEYTQTSVLGKHADISMLWTVTPVRTASFFSSNTGNTYSYLTTACFKTPNGATLQTTPTAYETCGRIPIFHTFLNSRETLYPPTVLGCVWDENGHGVIIRNIICESTHVRTWTSPPSGETLSHTILGYDEICSNYLHLAWFEVLIAV